MEKQEENEEFTKDGKKRNFLQRMAYKIAQFLKKILRVVFGNPIPWVILTAFVFGRFYELGYFGMKGTTVRVTGVCADFYDNPRSNLAEDQIVVSSISQESLEGIIRKTREYVKCDLSRISIDRVGAIKELVNFNATISIPEITKMIIKEVSVSNFTQYINKDLIVSGTCMDPKSNKILEPFIRQTISVTNVKTSEENSNVAYFYGVRGDKQSVVCDTQDITYEIVGSTNILASKDVKETIKDIDPLSVSLVGQKVFLTALCFPDFRVYRALGTKPKIKNYNLQKTPVEVIEEERDASGKVIKIVGSVLAKSVRIGDKEIPVLGHKIRCDQSTFPMIIVTSDDPKVKIEESSVSGQ
jgi:hypothetical protein